LLRNELLNPIVPPLFGADGIENKASSIVACWAVFTELLPGNAICYNMFVVNANMYHDFMNLLFFMSVCYVYIIMYLHAPFV
jgi:hypothetical protein